MISMAQKLSRFLLSLTGLVFVVPAWSAGYTITDLGFWGVGGYSDRAYDINNSGQIVGIARFPDQPYHQASAFVYHNGTMTSIGTLPGYDFGRATVINNNGQVAGTASPFSTMHGHLSPTSAFIYSQGNMTDLGALLGSYQSSAEAINDKGQIVGSQTAGYNSAAGFVRRAFLYSDGTTTDLGPVTALDINNSGQIVGKSGLSGLTAFLYMDGNMIDLGNLGGDGGSLDHLRGGSIANAINNNGDIVGGAGIEISGDVTTHAFLYRDWTMLDLGTLPGDNVSEALRINDRGEIIGYSWHDFNQRHPFLYRDGEMVGLDSLIDPESGWALEEVTAINDLGQILGRGTLNGERYHSFLISPDEQAPAPVPVPAAAWLFISGILGLATVARRRG